MITETKNMILGKWWNYCQRHGYIYQQPSDVDYNEQTGVAVLSNINGVLAVVTNYDKRAKFITDEEEIKSFHIN